MSVPKLFGPLLLLTLLPALGCGHEPPSTSPAAGSGQEYPDVDVQDPTPDDPADPEWTATPQAGIEVDIHSGTVRGVQHDGLRVWKGIPFAEPPIGERRFRAPEPVEPWDTIFVADQFGAACPQDTTGFGLALGPDAARTSEDCLSINVWAHDDGADLSIKRPVMVWIYGGGFMAGASSWPIYDAAQMAERGDVVVVSFNYRLGMLGYLASDALMAEDPEGTAGNYGVRDQIAALQWVQQNIAVFGGDPDNVTVFGESAGAVSVCALLGAPAADALFHKAIIESGMCSFAELNTTATNGMFAGLDVRTAGRALIEEVGCDGAFDELACLRSLPADELVAAVSLLAVFLADVQALGAITPIVDGALIPQQPLVRLSSVGADKPLIVGSNKHEGTLFTSADVVLTRWDLENHLEEVIPNGALVDAVMDIYPWRDFFFPKDAWSAFMGDVTFICSGLRAAQEASAGAPAFAYHFTRASPLSVLGPSHAAELPYVFGTFDSMAQIPTNADKELSDAMQTAWTTFAHNGTPSLEPEWRPWRADAPSVALLDADIKHQADIRDGRCAALHELGLVP